MQNKQTKKPHGFQCISGTVQFYNWWVLNYFFLNLSKGNKLVWYRNLFTPLEVVGVCLTIGFFPTKKSDIFLVYQCLIQRKFHSGSCRPTIQIRNLKGAGGCMDKHPHVCGKYVALGWNSDVRPSETWARACGLYMQKVRTHTVWSWTDCDGAAKQLYRPTDSVLERDQSNFSYVSRPFGSQLWGHGGTGPGEHQPAGQVRVPFGPSEAGLVRSGVHHAEVSAGGRTAQLPLGFPEGRRSDNGPQCGAGEENTYWIWSRFGFPCACVTSRNLCQMLLNDILWGWFLWAVLCVWPHPRSLCHSLVWKRDIFHRWVLMKLLVYVKSCLSIQLSQQNV